MIENILEHDWFLCICFLPAGLCCSENGQVTQPLVHMCSCFESPVGVHSETGPVQVWRHYSYLSKVCVICDSGLGGLGLWFLHVETEALYCSAIVLWVSLSVF